MILLVKDVYDPGRPASVVVRGDQPPEDVMLRFAEESPLRDCGAKRPQPDA